MENAPPDSPRALLSRPLAGFGARLLLGLVLAVRFFPGPAAAAQEPSPSPWLEARKVIGRELVKGRFYDVLVVPFQVQGPAVDRPARSLMTRYLVEAIKRWTALRLPSPTLVARALGEDARVFDEKEVYRLAEDLKVGRLIRCYVSHDGDEWMNVTFLMQRGANGVFNPEWPTDREEWRGIAFSDEQPPEESFRALLGGIIPKLGLGAVAKPEEVPVGETEPPPVPDLKTLAEPGAGRPLDDARRLQFLGALHPREATVKEHLFERSLAALSTVSPRSPGHRLLAARALLNLHRRPAAVATLGEARGAEEKAFAAYLEGDLPEMEKQVRDIAPPLPRLMAELELNDLRWLYDKHLPRQEAYEGLAGEHPAWELLIYSRLQSVNQWAVPVNLVFKKDMDRVFPLPGFTADSLFSGQVGLGQPGLDSEEVEFSVREHCRRVMSARGAELAAADDSARPVERDVLELYESWGLANLLKKAELKIRVQSLPEAGLKLIDLYDTVYRGLPDLAYWRWQALSRRSREKSGEIKDSLVKSARENAADAFHWSLGQTAVADDSWDYLDDTGKDMKPYEAYNRDYPRRWYWNYASPGDRREINKKGLTGRNVTAILADKTNYRNTEISLLYCLTNFSYLSRYHNYLSEKKGDDAAGRFLDANRRRFTGNPQRITFLAGLREKQGDTLGARAVYEEAMSLTPEIWQSYWDYGWLLIKEGEFKKASETYRKYPLFLEASGADKVALSNYAFNAGSHLWWRGEVDEAVPLFLIAADSRTGSGAEMASAAFLAMIEGDYQRAAAFSLQHAKRYNTDYAFDYYMQILHLSGYGQMAWSLFDTIIGKVSGDAIWHSVMVGLRFEGQTDEVLTEWLDRETVRSAVKEKIGHRMLNLYLTDRPPNAELPRLIREAVTKAPRSENASGTNWPPDWALLPADLAESYGLIRRGMFAQAYKVLEGKLPLLRKDDNCLNVALPYLAWSAAKCGKLPEAAKVIDGQKKDNPFSFHLARALVLGAEGRVAESVVSLKAAFHQVPSTGSRSIFPWYQLVETAEWLYEDTKNPAYRELVLDLARRHQRTQPMYAWPYAVEAKYAEEGFDRRRALAFALHLDRRSERIAGFSEAEKAAAADWFKANNPFEEKPKPKGI